MRQIVPGRGGTSSLSGAAGGVRLRAPAAAASAVAAERPLAGQHLVEDHAQAVDVAAGVDVVRLAARLFGRHVGRRAHDLAVRRHRLAVGVALGEAEVGDVRPALAVEEDVRRLDVAVDDAVVVGVLQGVGHLGDELGRPAGIDGGLCAAPLPGSRPRRIP